MCVLSVASNAQEGQAATRPPRGKRAPGWPKYPAESTSEGPRRAIPDRPTEYARARAWGELPGGNLDWSLAQRAGVSQAYDRRSAPRIRVEETSTSAIVLTDQERSVARAQLAAAASCGSGMVAIRRYEDDDQGEREVRMIVPTHCGTRRCERCSEAIRHHQIERCEGPWRMFLTLTRAPELTQRQELLRVHGWLREWHRELRRELAISRRRWPEKGERRWRQRRRRIEHARSRIRVSGDLDYAWVIELHASGYPHVHEVLTTEWLDYKWARAVWRRACRSQRASVHGKTVESKSGVNRYLAKYQGKSTLPPEALALIRGRRTWATTLAKPLGTDDGGVIESLEDAQDLRAQVLSRRTWGRDEGWIYECGADETYARWWRPNPAPAVRVIPADWILLGVDDAGATPGNSTSRARYRSGALDDYNAIRWRLLIDHLKNH